MHKRAKQVLIMAVTVLAIPVFAPVASAQFGGNRIKRPFNRPTISPYVNLIGRGGGNSAVMSYYGAVRPQMQFYEQDQRLSQGLNTLRTNQMFPQQRNRRRNDQDGEPSLRRYQMGVTGHSVSFMTIGGGAGGSGGGVLGGSDSSGGGFAGGTDSFNGGGFGGGFSRGTGTSGHSARFGFGTMGSGSQRF